MLIETLYAPYGHTPMRDSRGADEGCIDAVGEFLSGEHSLVWW